MNKELMLAAGFGENVTRMEAGKCATCATPVSQADVHVMDALSQREFAISGMCQTCQDGVFG